MTKNDGGPAFPFAWPQHLPPREDGVVGADGMTLRDYFAGQAMAGFFAHPDVFAPYAGKGEKPEDRAARMVDSIAVTAYSVADAMLAERDR